MQADLFYQDKAENTQLLLLVSQKQWQEGLPLLTPLEKTALNTQHFQGKLGEMAFIKEAQTGAETVYFGSGEEDLSLALATAATQLPEGAYRVEAVLPDNAYLLWSLAQYKLDAYKKNPLGPRVLFVPQKDLPAVLELARAIFLVRDLINTPANAMTPKTLSQVLSDMAATFGASFEEWVGEGLLAANFPAIYTVGRASEHPPRLLRLQWGDVTHPRVTLVGKGVCFDSGGYNIKVGEGMRLMKKDMGGAAQVLGLTQWIMASQLKLRLEVLLPVLENLVGPAAFKPGDVLTMRNGLTVEIDNTDAEGRLVLADALSFALESNPELLVDFATLTGAARVAVGTEIAAMFCNDEALSDDFLKASKAVTDPIWPLPLFKPYESMFRSSIADMSNCCMLSYGGAITAALFLQRFIKAEIPWAHFDIMAWNLSSKPGKPEGGEAMGLRALAYYLQKKYPKD